MRVQGVRAKNFRCLVDLDLKLRPFTVIIGPNGAGKSTLLDAIRLLCWPSGGPGLPQTIARMGGFNAAVWYHATEPVIELGINAGDEKEVFRYDFQLRGERGGYFVESETLVSRSAGTLMERKDQTIAWQQGKTGTSHGPELVLPGFVNNIPAAQPFTEELKRTSLWRAHEFLLNDRTRGPQPLQPTKFPTRDGSDLLSALYTLKTERRHVFRQLLEAMQSAVPELEEMEFPLAGAGHVNLTWKQSNLPRELYLNQLSDGTLRLLWLMSILHAVPDDGLVLIDEPELSLHPQWILLLVSVMRKMSARMNIVVATQSSEFIRWVEPDELLIADLAEAGAKFSWASDRNDLDDWLKDFTLAQLWTMGELGGRR